MTWAEWEAAVFGDDGQRRQQIALYCERHRNKALQTSDWQDRIEKMPSVLRGKPVIKGTRISVELIVGYLAGGAWSEEDILANYPGVTPEDIEACRQFAATGEPLYAMSREEFEAAVFGDKAKPNQRKA